MRAVTKVPTGKTRTVHALTFDKVITLMIESIQTRPLCQVQVRMRENR